MSGPGQVGQPLATIAVAAHNLNVGYNYGGMQIAMGPDQPVISQENGQIVGYVPQWLVTAQLSPQVAVQLHALLGQVIEEYERRNGPINRLAVPFSHPNTGDTGTPNVVSFEAASRGPWPDAPPIERARTQFEGVAAACTDCGRWNGEGHEVDCKFHPNNAPPAGGGFTRF